MKKANMKICGLVIFVAVFSIFSSAFGSFQINTEIKGLVTNSIKYKVGYNFSPYKDGQDPNKCIEISEEQIEERLDIITPYTDKIRTFSMTHGLEDIPRLAKKRGLKVVAGAWIDGDLKTNEEEIEGLIKAIKEGYVDVAAVGNEVLLRNDTTVTKLIEYINKVKKVAKPLNVPVTTVDVYSNYNKYPELVSAVDVIYANMYPFWEAKSLDIAMWSLNNEYEKLLKNSQGKKVVVSESGWPSAGSPIGKAVPSLANATKYFINFVSWARALNIEYYYFSAFDEKWKKEATVGPHWGNFDSSGNLKPGMGKVFLGETVPDNWSANNLIGGPGDPKIVVPNPPEYGTTERLKGKVYHIQPKDYRIVIYIYVPGAGYWIKPYKGSILDIDLDGGFSCSVTTGGSDTKAEEIHLFLVKKDYKLPGNTPMRGDFQHTKKHAVSHLFIERDPK